MPFDFKKEITQTRDEVFLFKFSGIIKNVGEMLYNAARELSDYSSYWQSEFPVFATLDKMDEQARFNSLAAFTGPEFLRHMTGSQGAWERRGSEKNINDYAKLSSLMNPFHASVTNFELMLHEFLNHPFCRKVYIYDVAFSDIKTQFLQSAFRSNGGKISLLSGTLFDIVKDKKEITTIFSDSAGEVVELIQSEKQGTEAFKEKLFCISALPNVMTDQLSNPNRKYIYQHQKFLSETRERFGCATTWVQLKYVTRFNTPDAPNVIIKGEKNQRIT